MSGIKYTEGGFIFKGTLSEIFLKELSLWVPYSWTIDGIFLDGKWITNWQRFECGK